MVPGRNEISSDYSIGKRPRTRLFSSGLWLPELRRGLSRFVGKEEERRVHRLGGAVFFSGLI